MSQGARPRVALVAHDVHDGGGMERAFAELVRHLHADHDVVVISSRLAPELRELVTWQRVRVPRAPFPLKFATFFVLAGWRLGRLQVDLVHTLGAIVPNRVDVAAVHFCHADYRRATGSLAPPDAAPVRRLNTALARALALAAERWCYRPERLSVLVAVSTGVARATARHYPGVPVEVVANGVDANRFRPDAGVRREMRSSIPQDETVLLFVGGDWERKGLAVAIEAAALLIERGRAVRLWVVGEGAVERYRAQAERLGVADHVSFFGARSDAERWFRGADLFLLPTLYETFSLVAHEAAACGLPVVAPSVHGVDELVGDGEAGVLVEPRPDAVAAALDRLVVDPALRARLGAEGRRRTTGLTWGRAAMHTRGVYENLRSGSPLEGAGGGGGEGADRSDPRPTVSVVVPTWRRPDALRRCLDGLAGSDRPPDEVIVVRRNEDTGAAAVVAASPLRGLQERIVDRPGQVAALGAGSSAACGEVVVFLDDDAVPRRDWLRRLTAHYVDPRVGAVGGRDVVHHSSGILDGACGPVGQVTSWGRVLGDHHLGTGAARVVDHLKGANMSVRRPLLRLPGGLRGTGAQVANDLAISMAVSESGAFVVYEPAAIVDHHPAERFDDDGRQHRSASAIEDAAYNQSFVVMSLRRGARRRRLLHQTIVGERWSPGLVRAAAALGAGEREVFALGGAVGAGAGPGLPRLPAPASGDDGTVAAGRRGGPVTSAVEAHPGPRPLLLGMGWFPDQPGGLNRYLRGLLTALRSQCVGARAVVVGPAEDAPSHVRAVGSHARRATVRVGALARAGRWAAADAEVVDAHFAAYALPALLASRRLRRLPLVVHFQGPWAAESRLEGEGRSIALAAKYAIERALYRRAKECVTLTAAFKQVLVLSYGVSPWDVHVIPPGVELDQFRPGDRDAARRALGLDADTWVGLSVRRLVPRMGLETLLEAWAKAGEDGPPALLLIAGDGPSRPGLEARARALGLADAVRFLGRVSDEALRQCYRAADVALVPTVALEGFGLVVLEALACGTPVVATDAGGLPEALAGLDASLIVPAEDPSALADRLRTARSGDEPLPSPERCRAYAERFSWARAAQRTVAVYSRAVRRPPDRRIRVVFLDHCARLSGAELSLVRLLPALHEIDAHVVLAEDGPLVGRLQRAGASVEMLPMAERARGLTRDRVRPGATSLGTAGSTAWYVVRLARRLRQLRPDLVHTNSLKAALYGVAAARLAGVPTVWHIRDRIAADYLPPPAVGLVRRVAGRLPSAVIGNSEATLSTLRVPMRHAVVPSPVLVHEAVDRPDALRRTSHASLRVGIVGRLAPWKGQELFLRSFAQAFPDGDQQAVVIGAALFGEDAYEESLHQLADRLGLGDRVLFTGFREDVARELSELDILVHASTIPEPFGQVVVEGMAARLPVVAPDVGGPAEVITDGWDGLLYPLGDEQALASRLRLLATEPGLRARLGAAGYDRAVDFTPEVAAGKVMQLYRDVLSDRSPHRRRGGPR
ncbi:hypothetical protein BH18ACT1_BH18ACT1_00100 [soil metagenome]